jgi:hypothetical protein
VADSRHGLLTTKNTKGTKFILFFVIFVSFVDHSCWVLEEYMLLPTSVIGSYAWPSWFITAVEAMKRGTIDAFEYEAVRWGQKPQIKQVDAENLRVEAERNDVLLSLHGSYFINLTAAEKDVMERAIFKTVQKLGVIPKKDP